MDARLIRLTCPYRIGPAGIQRHLDLSFLAQVVDGQEDLTPVQLGTEVHNIFQGTIGPQLFQRASDSINGGRSCLILSHLFVLSQILQCRQTTNRVKLRFGSVSRVNIAGARLRGRDGRLKTVF